MEALREWAKACPKTELREAYESSTGTEAWRYARMLELIRVCLAI